MKQMYFIAYYTDGNGKQLDFERFYYKTLKRTREAVQELQQNEIFSILNKAAERVTIYATPDGYNHEPNPSAIYNIPAGTWEA